MKEEKEGERGGAGEEKKERPGGGGGGKNKGRRLSASLPMRRLERDASLASHAVTAVG